MLSPCGPPCDRPSGLSGGYRGCGRYPHSDPSGATDVRSLLKALQLSSLTAAFEERGVLQLGELTPALLEDMALGRGIRHRLLKALADLEAPAHRDVDSGQLPMDVCAAPDPRLPAQDHRQHNSTSSLYIESTISHPDLQQVRPFKRSCRLRRIRPFQAHTCADVPVVV